MEAREAGLGPKDSGMVAPQKLLVHLLVLLLRGAGGTQETGEARSGKPLGVVQQLDADPAPRISWKLGNWLSERKNNCPKSHKTR